MAVVLQLVRPMLAVGDICGGNACGGNACGVNACAANGCGLDGCMMNLNIDKLCAKLGAGV